MQDLSYHDASFPVREDFAKSHSRFWQRLASPGSWFTSAQRIAIASEVRGAQHCSLCRDRKVALSPGSIAGPHERASDAHTVQLSEPVIEAIHRITTDAARLSSGWYQRLLSDGLSEGQYVEIVGTVVAMVSIDSFAEGLGVPLRELPAPSDGEPSHYMPETATVTKDAWVPMVPQENAGTPEADLWPSGATGNVVRAMSLVPDEVRTLNDLSAAHYLAMPLVRQAGVDAGRALTRTQIELVAGRVSALNACFY